MEYLSLFVKSIFVDNMIFAYFLGSMENEYRKQPGLEQLTELICNR